MTTAHVRGFLALAAALLLLAACAAPTPTATPTKAPAAAVTPTKAPPTPTPVPVKVTFIHASLSTLYNPFYVALGGFFKEEAIEAEDIVVGAGSEATAALVGGNADFLMANTGDALSAMAQGQPLVIIAATVNDHPYSLVISKELAQRFGITYESSEEAKIKALKGLKLGITRPGSGTDFMTRYLLLKYNINPDRDVEIVSVGSVGSMVPALAKGQIDAYVVSSPTPDTSVARGEAIYLLRGPRGDFKEISPLAQTTLITQKRYVEKNPDVVKRVSRALVKAFKLIKENPNEAKALVRLKFPDMDQNLFEETWKNDLSLFRDPAVTREGYEANIRFLKATGVEIKVPYEQAVMPNFVEDAKRELGFK